MNKLLICLPFLILVILAGCGDGQNAERQQFREDMEEELSQLNEQIEDARQRLEGLSGESRQELEQTINELEARTEGLRQQLEETRGLSDEQWEAAQNEMEEAVNELEQAFNELRQPSG